MRLTVDGASCMGHGRCYQVAPDLLTFDDEGNLIREEDIYNPAKFATMTRDWCRVADAHGTLSEVGQRMLAALGG